MDNIMSSIAEIRENKGVECIQRGIAEGMARRNIEIAKTMLEKNVDINFISSITGLPVYQLKSIDNQQNK